MLYSDRFQTVDDLIVHMDVLIPSITADPFLQSRYTGLLAIAGVTAYELAIKDILYGFADKKHTVLGNVTRNQFERLNGRIKLKSLKDDHVSFFWRKIQK